MLVQSIKISYLAVCIAIIIMMQYSFIVAFRFQRNRNLFRNVQSLVNYASINTNRRKLFSSTTDTTSSPPLSAFTQSAFPSINQPNNNHKSTNSSSSPSSSSPLFRFGLIADIQYVDADDAMNFQGTKLRRYRHSLSVFQQAIAHWNQQTVGSTSILEFPNNNGNSTLTQNISDTEINSSSVTSTSQLPSSSLSTLISSSSHSSIAQPPSQSPPFTCSIVLGDILDGKTSVMKNQQECFQTLSTSIQSAMYDMYYCFGNHCHYSLSREELYTNFLLNNTLSSSSSPSLQMESESQEQRTSAAATIKIPITNTNISTRLNLFNATSVGGHCDASKLYYDWSPYPGWRFICIDSYDVSVIGASSTHNFNLAKVLLKQNNPHDLPISEMVQHAEKSKKRWVSYNGGVSHTQLHWLEKILKYSQHHKEKILIFSHQPIYSPTKPNSVIWNAEEILTLIHSPEYRNTVQCWIAGHDHDGQYQIDEYGTHHLIPPAPIESSPGDHTYGHIDVYDEKLVLQWWGKTPAVTDTVDPFPTVMKLNEW